MEVRHDYGGDVNCNGLTVTLSRYNDQGDNEIVVWIDGQEVFSDDSFGSNFSNTWTWDSEVNHTFRVRVQTHNNVGEFDTGVQEQIGCPVDTTPTTSPPSSSTTSTTAATTTIPTTTTSPVTTTTVSPPTTTELSTTTTAPSPSTSTPADTSWLMRAFEHCRADGSSYTRWRIQGEFIPLQYEVNLVASDGTVLETVVTSQLSGEFDSAPEDASVQAVHPSREATIANIVERPVPCSVFPVDIPEAPTTTVPTVGVPTQPPTPPRDELPVTGAGTEIMLVIAAALTVFGGLFKFAARVR